MAMKGKGGLWTERKLSAVGAYLTAYNTALSRQPFARVYLDAFAGSGDRELSDLPLFDNDSDIARLAKGSVRIALECDPPFNHLHFIEKNRRHVGELREIARHFQHKDIAIHHGDANQELVDICKSWDERRWRGVLFVDPYGCQVEWATLEAVAATKSMDVWLLFPVNAVRRMLPGNAAFGPGWKERLTLLFGTKAWFDHFYQRRKAGDDLFGHAAIELDRAATLDQIESYYRERLTTIFRGGVSKRALRLGPRSRDPLFSLFFACSNPSPIARRLAFDIANYLIRKWDV